MNRQTDRLTDQPTDRQTDMQTDRQENILPNLQTVHGYLQQCEQELQVVAAWAVEEKLLWQQCTAV